MSWHLSAAGTVADARVQVETARDEWDSAMFHQAKKLILAQLDGCPVGALVRIAAYGHNDSRTRRLHIDITHQQPRKESP